MTEISTKLKVSGIIFIVLAIILAITAALPYYYFDLKSSDGISTTVSSGYAMGNNALGYGGYLTIALFVVGAIFIFKNNKTRGAVLTTIGEASLLFNLIYLHVSIPQGFDLTQRGNYFTMQVGGYLAWFVFFAAFLVAIIVFTSKKPDAVNPPTQNLNYGTSNSISQIQPQPHYPENQESLFYCRHCGKEIKQGSTFCTFCGMQQ